MVMCTNLLGRITANYVEIDERTACNGKTRNLLMTEETRGILYTGCSSGRLLASGFYKWKQEKFI